MTALRGDYLDSGEDIVVDSDSQLDYLLDEAIGGRGLDIGDP